MQQDGSTAATDATDDYNHVPAAQPSTSPPSTLTFSRAGSRPWLALYEPATSLLAARATLNCVAPVIEGLAAPLPYELWLLICAALEEPRAVCRLACVCHQLRGVSWHPELWERLCRRTFPVRAGFSPCEELFREFHFSWRRMFMRRRRLRFDGFYCATHKRLLAGLNEGRGMKEAEKDFYNPLGRWVTYHRIVRFYASGDLFVYLSTGTAPTDASVKRAAQAADPARPRSLTQKLRSACWGTYRVDEARRDDAPSSTALEASVLLRSDDHPKMRTATVCYRMELRGDEAAAAATNSELGTLDHWIVHSEHDVQVLKIRDPVYAFYPFA